ncbi:MAG: hypothetical protein WCI18_09255 [Pseudomonadota bacterium]
MLFDHRIFAGFSSLALIAAVFWANAGVKKAIRNEQLTRSIEVEVNATPPELSQTSMELALIAYGFDLSLSGAHPSFDSKLSDRGITEKMGYEQGKIVKIGPSAFDSWALLGSTLSHELEIHCQQNFFLISLADSLGLYGTALAEREAYEWELKQGKRFGLIAEEQKLIRATVESYYPRDFRFSNKPKFQKSFASYLVKSSFLATDRSR